MSTVYVTFFSRSTSTRETENRGLEAVAMTVMRYRSSAGLTPFPCFCQASGGDEDHFVESEPVGDLTGRNEVAMVNGVEGATHHS